MTHKILVIDDSLQINKLITVTLKAKGFDVTGVLDGKSGLEEAGKVEYDLILLDIMMPEMDGYAVLEQLKSSGVLGDTPVVFLSGIQEEEEKKKAMDMGAAGFVKKPFNPVDLYKQVCGFLGID